MNFRSRSGKRGEPDINITPLVDCVFQLLIFFVLTTSFVTQETLEVELPTADASAQAKEPKQVLFLNVRRDGAVVREGRELNDVELRTLFRETVKHHDEPTLLLRADKSAQHGSVVRVMDMALRQRLTRLAIATQQDEAKK